MWEDLVHTKKAQSSLIFGLMSIKKDLSVKAWFEFELSFQHRLQ